jgi:hypothetical protein
MKLTSSKFRRGLIDIIIAMFGGRIPQQTRHSCVPLLVDLFLYSNEAYTGIMQVFFGHTSS